MENREYYLPELNFKVDGFDPETNTVYEFFGDYWHGNSERFDLLKINKTVNKTFGQLYQEAESRILRLKEAGYKVIFIWEKDFNLIKKGEHST